MNKQDTATLTEQIAVLSTQLKNMESKLNETRALVGPFGVPLPDDTMLVQTLHGQKYVIDPLDLIIAPNLIVYRQWEADLTRVLHAAANPSSVFIDVGANFGYFTCLVGSKIGNKASGRVIAIEPNPALARLLRKNAAINWSMCPIAIHECAVADRAGRLPFFIPNERAANASLTRMASNAETGKTTEVTVDVVTLDSLVPPELEVDLMKIDVEGHELAVLAGSENVLARSPDIRIVIEWSPPQMLSAGYTADAMISKLEQLDLAAYRIPKNELIRELQEPALDRATLASMSYDNLLLARKPA